MRNLHVKTSICSPRTRGREVGFKGNKVTACYRVDSPQHAARNATACSILTPSVNDDGGLLFWGGTVLRIRVRVLLVAIAASAVAIVAEQRIVEYLSSRPYMLTWRDGQWTKVPIDAWPARDVTTRQ
jgi:hypothetical protein